MLSRDMASVRDDRLGVCGVPMRRFPTGSELAYRVARGTTALRGSLRIRSALALDAMCGRRR